MDDLNNNEALKQIFKNEIKLKTVTCHFRMH